MGFGVISGMLGVGTVTYVFLWFMLVHKQHRHEASETVSA